MAASLGVFAFLGSLGPMELVVIFLVILLLFGAKRIPEIARGLGKGIREFKSATKDIADEINAANRDIDTATRIDAPRKPVSGTAPRSTSYEDERGEAARRHEE